MGDLNFRLERPDALPASDIVSRIDKRDLTPLQKDDQLRQSREKKLAFQQLEEDPVEFAPTYKFVKNTDVYDAKSVVNIFLSNNNYFKKIFLGVALLGLTAFCIVTKTAQDCS